MCHLATLARRCIAVNKATRHRGKSIHSSIPWQKSWYRACSKRSQEECPALNLGHRRLRTSFEQGTGYDPELLATRAADELRHAVRSQRLEHVTPTIIELVSTRAERVWAAQPYWRKRWTRCARLGSVAPLMLFFRHWTHAAAVREGIAINSL